MNWTTLEHAHAVKVRKPHRCYGCKRVWPAGSKMLTWTGIYDGPPNRTYFCEVCMAYTARYPGAYGDEVPLFGYPNEDPDGYAEVECKLELQLLVITAGLKFVCSGRAG